MIEFMLGFFTGFVIGIAIGALILGYIFLSDYDYMKWR